MPPLIRLNELTVRFRGPPLLDRVTCSIEPGQRIGLLGRNGSGKTTFMRVLSGAVTPDGGQFAVAPGAKVSLLPQDVPQDLAGSVSDVVLASLPPEELDDSHLWQAQQRVNRLLSMMELDGALPANKLSSGMKRRVLLARALAPEPDLLLLDEPTNHLDIDTIAWLEDFLLRWPATLMFVTHDRAFLRRLATRILEIDRGRLFDWSCDYDEFLVRKDAALEAEEKQNALFDKKLAQEEAWIRQGVKARRTRNEGRVRALKQMRNQPERAAREDGHGQAGDPIRPNAAASWSPMPKAFRSPTTRPIVHDFSTTIMRGDKVGVIGPNGAGKTTLLQLLLRPAHAGKPGRSDWGLTCRSPISTSFASSSTKTRRFRTTWGRRRDTVDRRPVAACARLPAGFPVHAGASANAGPFSLRRRAKSSAAGPAVLEARPT